jgi:hypothetical protein
MKTILLAAAAALTLNAGIALADNGDSFDINSGTGTSAHFMQTAQPMQLRGAPADAPSTMISHSVSQTRDTRTGSVFDPINWGSG